MNRYFIRLALFAAGIAIAQPAAAQLANRTAEEWISTLDTKTRIESLKIAETMSKLGVKPGQVVADIGAGTGVFTIPFACLRRANGSFEPEGTKPTANIPAMLSALSAIESTAPSRVRGAESSVDSGLY